MLGENLKKLRGKRTQEDVAKLLGISRARYSHYENGARQPDFNTLEQLASFYNVTTDFLLGRTDDLNSSVFKLPKYQSSGKHQKDERDIAKQLKEFRDSIENSDGLAFDGEPMSEEAKESLIESMEHIFRQTQRINKKYAPNKYKDKE